MKTAFLTVLFLAIAIFNLPAAQYQITDHGPNYRVWNKTILQNGTNHVIGYTELATGLYYTNSSGQLTESCEQISILPGGGAAATQGLHQVYFPGDIYNGVIEVVTPDGRHLQSRPLGISYDDGSNTVFIATLTNSIGELASSNQVVYPNAFTGLKADLVCNYRRGGFECDLVMKQAPPTPDELGLDASYTTIQLVTEFFDTSDPQQIPANSDDWFGLQDATLKFGKLTMTHGKAFATKPPGGAVQSSQTPVYKSWLHLGGRTFLIEQVPLLNIADDLDALPLTATIQKPGRGAKRLAFGQALPPSRKISADTNQILLASADVKKEPGVVLDYNEIDTDISDVTFQSGATYYIGSECNFSGTTTFEGGAIIKASGAIDIDAAGTIVCPTDPSQPVVFTSPNDDSIGEPIGISSGSPNFMDVTTYLNINCPNPIIRNLCFNYGYQCINDQNGDSLEFDAWDCQFLQVDIAIEAGYGNMSLHNVLVQEVNEDYPFWVDSGDFYAENLTCDGYEGVASLPVGTAYLTNSLITGSGGGVYAVITNISAPTYYFTPTFQTAGRANFYLVANSPYRNIANTNIDPVLLAELQTMTTYAPQDGGFSDTNGADFGYHYPTNEDSDYDGIPDWWIYKFFGNYDENGTNMDAGGNSLLTDYQYNFDPNVIQFSVFFANSYINTNIVFGTINLIGGFPAYVAVLVNDTNFNDATWQTYNQNISANLTNGDGIYDVWVGLRGSPTNATQTWLPATLTLDTSPLLLTVTNPANSMVSVPMIEVQGLANKSLTAIIYDLSNASGTVTNQPCYVTGQSYNTNQQVTSAHFQCYDVPLTNGVNTITLHAIDIFGNASITNVSVTVDYGSAAPPNIAVLWPTNNAVVAGTNFMLQGLLDDGTVSVVANIGTSNFNGVVERDGHFSVTNLPLTATTNIFTIAATNAAGLGSTQTLTVIQGAVNVTIDALPTGQSSQEFITVTGTLSDTNHDVYVNGVQATVSGDPVWQADNVPVINLQGNGQLTVNAYPSGSDPAATPSTAGQQSQVTLPSVVQATSYTEQFHIQDTRHMANGNTQIFDSTWSRQWSNSIGGTSIAVHDDGIDESTTETLQWPAFWPNGHVASGTIVNARGTTGYSAATPSAWANADWMVAGAISPGGLILGSAERKLTRKAVTDVQLVASGPAQAGVLRFVRLVANAAGYSGNGLGNYADYYYIADYTGFEGFGDAVVAATNIEIFGQALVPTETNANYGEMYVLLPAGATQDLPLKITGTNAQNYSFNVQAVDCDCTNRTKADWQREVRNEIYFDTGGAADMDTYSAANGFLNNRTNLQAVYAFYQKLFNENTNLYWAGLGKLAGAPVYAGLSDAQYFGSFFASFQNTLVDMNTLILQDLAWQSEAYAKGGICALEEVAFNANYDTNVIDIKTWRQIDQGVQNGDANAVQQGNLLLANREQAKVLQPDYDVLDSMLGISTVMSIIANNPVPTGTDFKTVVPGGNLCTFPDRWNWITSSSGGIWPSWVAASPTDRSGWVNIPLTTRATNYATIFPVY